MNSDNKKEPKTELNEDDKTHIMETFHEEIVPKLAKSHGRNGVLNCSFAGEEYRNWNIFFTSNGPDFQISDFEYDEDTRPVKLDKKERLKN